PRPELAGSGPMGGRTRLDQAAEPAYKLTCTIELHQHPVASIRCRIPRELGQHACRRVPEIRQGPSQFLGRWALLGRQVGRLLLRPHHCATSRKAASIASASSVRRSASIRRYASIACSAVIAMAVPAIVCWSVGTLERYSCATS